MAFGFAGKLLEIDADGCGAECTVALTDDVRRSESGCETDGTSSELNSILIDIYGTAGLIHEVPRVRTRGRQAFHDHLSNTTFWWAKPSKLSMYLHCLLLCVPTL